jgi:hypothetical protein
MALDLVLDPAGGHAHMVRHDGGSAQVQLCLAAVAMNDSTTAFVADHIGRIRGLRRASCPRKRTCG